MNLVRSVTLLALVSVAAASKASPIRYTISSTASGQFNGLSYTQALVTITALADTSNITNPSAGFYRVDATATVSVAGLGTDAFVGPLQFFSSNPNGAVGLNAPNQFRDTLDRVSTPARRSRPPWARSRSTRRAIRPSGRRASPPSPAPSPPSPSR